MSSAAQKKANRENAARSTGPKTKAGKSSVAKNAVRHGLAISVLSLPELEREVEQLAHLLAGVGASDAKLSLARAVAAAQIDLKRIRTVRMQMLKNPKTFEPKVRLEDLKRLLRPRYQGIEFVEDDPRDMEAARRLHDWNDLWCERGFEEKFARAVQKLNPLDRYERRALSRRKMAIRRFYEAEA